MQGSNRGRQVPVSVYLGGRKPQTSAKESRPGCVQHVSSILKGPSMRSIILAIALLLPIHALAADEFPATLTVTGHGSASAAPDMATVLTGVESFAETASVALAMNSDQMTRVLAELADAGVAPKDIQTSNLSIQPRYSDRKSREAFQIEGYQVRNSLSVQVRDVTSLGTILDAIVRSGANRIDAVSFGFTDTKTLKQQARKDAVADARATAEIYATAAGVNLGDILTITDGSAPPRPMPGMAMAEMARSSVPIASGESSIGDSVRVVWELVQD